MTITQDNKTVASVDTSRTKYNSEMQQVRDGKMEYTSTINLRDKRYDSIMALAGLDGNTSDISWKDVNKAKSLKGKYGIQNVRYDGNAGIATLVFGDNTEIKIDVETGDEKAKRISAEKKAEAEAAKKRAEQQKQEAKKEPGWGDRFINWLEDLFDGNI